MEPRRVKKKKKKSGPGSIGAESRGMSSTKEHERACCAGIAEGRWSYLENSPLERGHRILLWPRRSSSPSTSSPFFHHFFLFLSLAFSPLRSSCLAEPAALAMLHATTGRGALLLYATARCSSYISLRQLRSSCRPCLPKTRRDPRRRRITGRRKENGREGERPRVR